MKKIGYLLLALTWSLAACDDPPPPKPPPPAPAPPARGGAPAPGGAPPAVAAPAAAEAKPAMELTERDFVEGAANRDPFRSFLGEFTQPTRRVVKRQVKVILPRYGLDELRLIAVVTGGTRPRAMFRDPTGLGVTVKRGDYISKNAGKVKQILTDKVVVEIEEQAEDRNTLVDRVIDLHPREAREDQEGEEEQQPE